MMPHDPSSSGTAGALSREDVVLAQARGLAEGDRLHVCRRHGVDPAELERRHAAVLSEGAELRRCADRRRTRERLIAERLLWRREAAVVAAVVRFAVRHGRLPGRPLAWQRQVALSRLRRDG